MLANFFVNLIQARFIWEEESSVEKMPPLDCLVVMSMEAFSSLMTDIGELSLLWVAPTLAVDPGVYKKANRTGQ